MAFPCMDALFTTLMADVESYVMELRTRYNLGSVQAFQTLVTYGSEVQFLRLSD